MVFVAVSPRLVDKRFAGRIECDDNVAVEFAAFVVAAVAVELIRLLFTGKIVSLIGLVVRGVLATTVISGAGVVIVAAGRPNDAKCIQFVAFIRRCRTATGRTRPSLPIYRKAFH